MKFVSLGSNIKQGRAHLCSYIWTNMTTGCIYICTHFVYHCKKLWAFKCMVWSNSSDFYAFVWGVIKIIWKGWGCLSLISLKLSLHVVKSRCIGGSMVLVLFWRVDTCTSITIWFSCPWNFLNIATLSFLSWVCGWQHLKLWRLDYKFVFGRGAASRCFSFLYWY